MKIKILVALGVIILLLLNAFAIQKLQQENKRLTSNQEILLMQDALKENQYRVNDSLSAIKINELQLSLNEYKNYRHEDSQLINKLNISTSTLQKIITTQTQTINNLKTQVHETIRLDTITNTIDTIKCFNYVSNWLNISGCIDKDSVDIQVINKESLLITESLQKKKFWFIKLPIWLFGYKNKQVDVLSKNPATQIINVEYINTVN